jgi:hypothetical protein
VQLIHSVKLSSKSNSKSAGSATASPGSGSRPVNLKSVYGIIFLRDSVRQTAQCKLCKASVKTGGGSTKSLHTHLQRKHDINVLKGKRAADSRSDDEGNGANSISVSLPNMDSKSVVPVIQ